MTRTILGFVLFAALLDAAIAAGSHAVTIDNRTGGVIRGVYVSPVGDDNWHKDHLTENIQAGDKRTIVLAGSACHDDLRILLEQRPEETLLFDVDVCRAPVLVVDRTIGRHVTRQAK